MVIDLLRASTTICAALHAGATRVVPVLEVAHAEEERRRLRDQGVVLGGERHGKKIPGFDLGNSPSEYTRASVGGKTLVFTTTNGTRAAWAARGAARVYVGCFGNLSAVADACVSAGTDVHLVCAGTGGEVAAEDCLFAGALAERLAEAGLGLGNDSAVLVLEAWRGVMETPGRVLEVLRGARGGQNLAAIGLGADIEQCAEVDVYAVVPRLVEGGFVG